MKQAKNANEVDEAKRKKQKMRAEIKRKKKELRAEVYAKYGLTPNQAIAIYEQQGRKCGICDEPKELAKLHVDHNHKTREVRGLLCPRCNNGLGWIEDKEFLEKAQSYLLKQVNVLSEINIERQELAVSA